MSTLNQRQSYLAPSRRDGQILGSDGGGSSYGGGNAAGASSSGGMTLELQAEIVARESGDTSLSTALSVEISGSVHTDGSPLVSQIGVFTGSAVHKIDASTGLTYNGQELMTDGDIVSPTFFSGFAGSGFKIDKEQNGDYTATFDNLTIRKMMKVYELQISKISAINGGLLISCANNRSIGISGTTQIWFDTNSNKSPIQFIADDWIRAQQWNNGINYFQGQVDGTPGSNYIYVKNITGAIWDGSMDLVQVGHPSNVARQNIIYITASDTNNPYIDFLSGVTNGSFAGHNVVRIGNLEGISDSAFGGALHSAGLYGSNVYLKGRVQIASTDVSGLGSLATKSSVDLNSGEVTNKSLAYLDSSASSKLSGIDAGAKSGATWGSNLWGIPNYLGTPSTPGLYMDGNALGYYNSGWKSYINKDGDFSFGTYGGGGNGISWTQSTGALSIRGAIVITAGGSVDYSLVGGTKPPADADHTASNTAAGIVGQGSLATANGVNWSTQVSGTGKPDNNATVGAVWGSNLSGIPNGLLAPGSTPGLYLTSSYLGYFNGSTWPSYIDSAGNCSFTGVGSFTCSTVAESGNQMGISISGDDIYENFYAGNGGKLYINRKGYAGGNSYYRETFIGDGVGGQVASFYYDGTYKNQDTLQVFGQLKFFDETGRFVPPKMTSAQARARRDYGVGATTGEVVWISDWGTGQLAVMMGSGEWWNVTMHGGLG